MWIRKNTKTVSYEGRTNNTPKTERQRRREQILTRTTEVRVSRWLRRPACEKITHKKKELTLYFSGSSFSAPHISGDRVPGLTCSWRKRKNTAPEQWWLFSGRGDDRIALRNTGWRRIKANRNKRQISPLTFVPGKSSSSEKQKQKSHDFRTMSGGDVTEGRRARRTGARRTELTGGRRSGSHDTCPPFLAFASRNCPVFSVSPLNPFDSSRDLRALSLIIFFFSLWAWAVSSAEKKKKKKRKARKSTSRRNCFVRNERRP